MGLPKVRKWARFLPIESDDRKKSEQHHEQQALAPVENSITHPCNASSPIAHDSTTRARRTRGFVKAAVAFELSQIALALLIYAGLLATHDWSPFAVLHIVTAGHLG